MIAAWNDLMYSIICQNQNVILNRIRQKQDVDEYDWLIQTVACQPWPADFQGRYRLFFVMGRVSASYYTPYFQALGAACTQTPNLGQLCAALCPFSTRKKKNSQQTIQTLQFSYPTKLCHMVSPKLPIYDSRVARFYLFQEPSTHWPLPTRITAYVAFHDFLRDEYARILSGNLLKPAIDGFKQRFNPKRHTDEKIIDWLIWAFIDWVDSGAMLNGQVAYS
jgi:hypothetical protein